MTGILSCLDAGTGNRLWRKECKPYRPYGGNSPLVADGLCIVHFGDSDKGKLQGGVTAFDAVTGEVKWCYADGSRDSSSSPLLVTLVDERQVVLFSAWELLGISADRGNKLLSLNTFDLKSGGKLVVVNPNSEQYQPLAEYRVSDTQTWAHPVFLGDHILIRDQMTLRCLAIPEAGK
jgi:hypothetical protein